MIAADALSRRLLELGVKRIWGEALPGSDDRQVPLHVAVREADLAVLLADADGRIGEVDGRARLGAALLPGPILHLSSKPGGTAPLQTVGSPEEMLDALVGPTGVLIPGTMALHLDFDLHAEVPEDLSAAAQPERQTVLTLDPSMAGLRFATVVGPGVVRSAALDGLRSFSRAAGSGVFNTWGAKGVERWDSPWHFGTIGVQEGDIALAHIHDADVLVVSGLDPDELSAQDIGHPVTQEVHPAQLGALCTRWETTQDPPSERPPLYSELSGVLTSAYEDDSAPLSAARAALHLSGALPDGGMAVVDGGPAGFWVARAFPTSIPNSVVVPAGDPRASAGFAAAAAMICAVEDRPVLAVTDAAGADTPETAAVLAFAQERGVPVALQVWRDPTQGDTVANWTSADQHVRLLEEHLDPEVVRVDDVPVRLGETAGLVGVAGEPRTGLRAD